MLTWVEKLRTGAPLVPMLVGGQDYINAQDELDVQTWMKKNFMPERVREELFIAMGGVRSLVAQVDTHLFDSCLV